MTKSRRFEEFKHKPRHGSWRAKTHEIIFEADTPAGKGFDVALIVTIVLSVIVVMLDSVGAINRTHGTFLFRVEWLFTLLFTAEYILRLLCIGKPARYATSFFGVVDVLAILPTYLSLIIPGSQYFLVIRILRVLRIFRVLKIVQYLTEADILLQAFRASRRKITIFLFAVLSIVIVFGSFMYVIEGEENGFTSIPRSIYWAIVTLTTVGYGDISPRTGLGQAVAAFVMILGYSILAVPTGIVTAELTQASSRPVSTQACRECSDEGHHPEARHCKNCGALL